MRTRLLLAALPLLVLSPLTASAQPQQYAPQQYAPQQYAPQQYAPQQYAPQQYAPQQYAPYPQPPPQPIVELRSADPAASLFQLTGGGTRLRFGRRHSYYSHYEVWDPVCRTPCGVPYDPSGVYQIRGLHINRSSTFVLPQTSVVMLDVDAGHTGPRAGGVILTTFGGIATVVGIVFTGVGFGVRSRDAATGSSSGNGFLTAGGVTLGLGTAMLAGGIAMLVLSRTTVRISGGSRLAASPRPPRLALLSDGLHF